MACLSRVPRTTYSYLWIMSVGSSLANSGELATRIVAALPTVKTVGTGCDLHLAVTRDLAQPLEAIRVQRSIVSVWLVFQRHFKYMPIYY